MGSFLSTITPANGEPSVSLRVGVRQPQPAGIGSSAPVNFFPETFFRGTTCATTHAGFAAKACRATTQLSLPNQEGDPTGLADAFST